MNKKLIISLGIVAVLSTVAAYADTTIYTDSIGRFHFLGRDAANNTSKGANYSNSAEQDLTRKLYEQAESGVVNDTTYDQHPLKNYENTFPDSRFTTTKYWQPKEDAEANGIVNTSGDSRKSTVTATKYATDPSNPYAYGTTILNKQPEQNVVKTKAKKHWWNRNK